MRMFVFTIIGIWRDSRERTKMRLLPRSSWVQGDLPLKIGRGFVPAEMHIPAGFGGWDDLHS